MKRLALVLVVLVGLLVAVDYGAAALAESAVARQMRDQLGLDDDPGVRINGFPFLVQAISGEYDSVDVDAFRVHVGEFRDLHVHAELRGVQAPLGELLGSGLRRVAVREAEGTVRVLPNDLERLMPGIDRMRIETIDDEALEKAVEDGGDPSLREIDPDRAARLAGTATLLGQELPISAIAVLELADGQIRIVPRDVRVGDDDAPPLPAPLQRQLREMFTLRVDPGSLPLDVTPTSLRARDGALEISGITRNLVLGAGGQTVTGS
jgi:hypothetical protein